MLWSPVAAEEPVAALAPEVGVLEPVVGAGGAGGSETSPVSAVPTDVLLPVFAVPVPVVTTVASWSLVLSGPPAPAGVGGVGSATGTVGGGCDTSVVTVGAVVSVVGLWVTADGSPSRACARPLKSRSAQKPRAQMNSARTVNLAAVTTIEGSPGTGEGPARAPPHVSYATISG